MSLRCWLFGHDWLHHFETTFVPPTSGILRSFHVCDRCGERRTVNKKKVPHTDIDKIPDGMLNYGDVADEKRKNIEKEIREMVDAADAAESFGGSPGANE